MKRYIAILKIDDDEEVVGSIDATVSYVYRKNGTNYATTESVEFEVESEEKGMTREEKQKAINALKKSAPLMALTQKEFSDYIQTINQVIDWLEQEPVLEKDCNTCTHGNETDGSNCYECIKDTCNNYKPTTKNDLGIEDEERTLALMYLEQIKEDYIEGAGFERHPLPEYYAIEIAIKSLALPSVTPQEQFINKPCVSEKVCEHDKKVIFDKIRAKIDNAIEFERKWLYDAGYISKDIDIALDAIKSVMAESED